MATNYLAFAILPHFLWFGILLQFVCTHEVVVVVDKLMDDILEPLDAIHGSGGDQTDDDVQATGGL